MVGKAPEQATPHRLMKPSLTYSIFAPSKWLKAADLSRRQPKQEQCNDGRVGMHGAVNSAAYYRNREQTERTLAGQAASAAIRNIHLEMAERYREHAEQLEMPTALRSIA